ncbi:DUF7521 family protein [Haladaptatus salinisoli]|uniref:DUF7521 family protein n=1 Tax=Haladaptatus salinisoli TaxID=2884876 RepID=UPI001D09ACF0|nr:hypothetical protein [Haladaptatus salinisoli]
MHLGLIIAKVIIVILGLLISFQSYRAYKRYDSQPMFLLAVGFFMISIGAVTEGVLYDVVNFSIFYAGMIQSTIVAIGMCFILYSIHYQTQ